jgi:hypothetical protein
VSSSGLRTCEKCHQPWPKGDDHDLRGFRWLDPLPRNISVSNADLLIHDGMHGQDRYLFFEVKMPWEPPLQRGQNWLLSAIAKQPHWTVRILHGTLHKMTIYRVRASGVDPVGALVVPSTVRASVTDWLNGSSWQVHGAQAVKAPVTTHTCGWAQRDGSWICAQDYFAKGMAPETACGAVWVQP